MNSVQSQVPLIASCGDCVKIWDAKSLEEVQDYNFHNGNVHDISWKKDNSSLCSSGQNCKKICITHLNLNTNKIPEQIYELNMKHSHSCILTNRNGKKLYTAGLSGNVGIWDLNSFKLRKSFNDNLQQVTCIALNYCETHLATGSGKQKSVVIRELSTGHISKPKYGNLPNVSICSMTFSPWVENHLGMVFNDGSLCIWDVLSSTKYHLFNHHKAPATNLAFSPFNDLLLASVGVDKTLILYDATIKNYISKCVVSEPLLSVTVENDGHTVYAGSSLGSIFQFDMRSFEKPIKKVSNAHNCAVRKIISQNKTRSSKGSRTSKKSVITLEVAEKEDNLKKLWSHKTSMSSDHSTASSAHSKSTTTSGKEIQKGCSERASQKVPTTSSNPAASVNISSSSVESITSKKWPQIDFNLSTSVGNSTASSIEGISIEAKSTPKTCVETSSEKQQILRKKGFDSPQYQIQSPDRIKYNDKVLKDSTATFRGDGEGLKSSTPSDLVATTNQTPSDLVATTNQTTSDSFFQFIRQIVDESTEKLRCEMQEGMSSIHLHLAKMTMKLEDHIQRSSCDCSLNKELLEENLKLREEIDRMKRIF